MFKMVGFYAAYNLCAQQIFLQSFRGRSRFVLSFVLNVFAYLYSCLNIRDENVLINGEDYA